MMLPTIILLAQDFQFDSHSVIPDRVSTNKKKLDVADNNSSRLIYANRGGTVRLWDLHSGEELKAI